MPTLSKYIFPTNQIQYQKSFFFHGSPLLTLTTTITDFASPQVHHLAGAFLMRVLTIFLK